MPELFYALTGAGSPEKIAVRWPLSSYSAFQEVENGIYRFSKRSVPGDLEHHSVYKARRALGKAFRLPEGRPDHGRQKQGGKTLKKRHDNIGICYSIK